VITGNDQYWILIHRLILELDRVLVVDFIINKSVKVLIVRDIKLLARAWKVKEQHEFWKAN
jgi:hypothetical protein